MKPIITALLAMSWLFFFLIGPIHGQTPAGVAVGFQNHTNSSVLVQGYTVVNHNKRPGQTLMVQKNGGKAFESSAPPGIRYYTIYDANSTRILLKEHPVQVTTRDLFYRIKSTPSGGVILEATIP